MKFKITLPNQNIDIESIKNRNKAMFSEDLNKGGILTKTFLFCYLNEPASVSELTKLISKYYHIDVDRTLISRALQKLNEKHILNKANSMDIAHLHDEEITPIHLKMKDKHFTFLKPIPKHFRSNFSSVNYFWVANGNGLDYIEWACKLLNFKCEVQKE